VLEEITIDEKENDEVPMPQCPELMEREPVTVEAFNSLARYDKKGYRCYLSHLVGLLKDPKFEEFLEKSLDKFFTEQEAVDIRDSELLLCDEEIEQSSEDEEPNDAMEQGEPQTPDVNNNSLPVFPPATPHPGAVPLQPATCPVVPKTA